MVESGNWVPATEREGMHDLGVVWRDPFWLGVEVSTAELKFLAHGRIASMLRERAKVITTEAGS